MKRYTLTIEAIASGLGKEYVIVPRADDTGAWCHAPDVDAAYRELLKIKTAARRFVEQYDASFCWVENGGEEVSIAFDELIEALTKAPKEDSHE